MLTNTIRQNRRQAATHVRNAVRRRLLPPVALLLALCILWSFALGPAAIAAGARTPPPPRPHGAWVSPDRAARMKAQARHVQAMQQRARCHLFPYRRANATRLTGLHPAGQGGAKFVPLSILDEVGNLASPVNHQQAAAWQRELAAHLSPEEAAKRHVWLGEWRLAHDQEPEAAFAQFQAAQRLTEPADPVYGLAAYDRAMTFFTEGAYADAQTAFGHLLARVPRLGGFDRRGAALWKRHAGACAGYHADRARAGIPEPTRLDPLCGPAALAASLRALGRPYGRKAVLARMRVTGEGSYITDIVAAAPGLGANARMVRADDRGLELLPKPVVAFVEHDHFVSVVRADNKGVSYLCSDCGPWPGGRVDLTWRQWHLLDGGLYVAVTRPGTANDRLVAGLGAGNSVSAPALSASAPPAPLALPLPAVLAATRVPPASPVRLAFGGALPSLHLSLRPYLTRPYAVPMDVAFAVQLAALRAHAVLTFVSVGSGCGGKVSSLHCPKCLVCCLMMVLGMEPWSPTAGDPVNLATGEEEYAPAPDITVYNPHGPGVTWQRIYGSLRGPGQGFLEPGEAVGDFDYEMNDFGEGWSNTYNVGVSDQYPGYVGIQYPKNVFFENGARIQFVVPSSPTASTPQVLCQPYQGGQPLGGVPFLIYADYGAAGNYYSILWKDRTQWVTSPSCGMTNPTVTGGTAAVAVYPLGQIVDRNGHAIAFHYGPAAAGNTAGGAFQWPLLSSITGEDGTALLTVVRVGDGSGSVAAVYDCYGRSVLYHVAAFVNHSGTNMPGHYVVFGGLDHVSQLVATGTGSAPDRYAYGYENYSYGQPFLNTISVPSPTGGSTPSTVTINYDLTGQTVSSIVDANGNTTTFQSVTVTGTSGSGAAPGSSGAPGGTLTAGAAPGGLSTNYAQVTVSGPGGAVAYSYVGGFDNNMSGALQTDGAGRVTMSKVFSAASPDPFEPTSVTDGNGNTSAYTYDQYGNELTETPPSSSARTPAATVNTYDYSRFALGELTRTQEGTKTATTYAYDEPSGLVASVNSPAPGTAGAGATVQTSYAYDGYGNVLSVTAPGNNAASTIATTFTYASPAAIGQPLTVTDALGHVTAYTYDAQGNHTSATDAQGNATFYGNASGQGGYNIANQPVQVTSPATGQSGAGHGVVATAYLYPGGPPVAVRTYDEGGTAIREVDTAYGPDGETRSVSGSTEPVSYTYDALYRMTTLTDGGGHATQYFYGAAGYLSQTAYPLSGATTAPLAPGSSDTVTYTGYDADGDLLARVDGNGTTTTYTYADPESLLTNIHYALPSSPPAYITPLADTAYAYDAYGRRTQMTDATGQQSDTYDDGDSPLAVTTTYTGLPAETVGYTYFPDGSRQTMTTPAGAFSYTYDAAGRETGLTNPFGEASAWAYSDNDWLQTQSINGGGGVTAYAYDAKGETTDAHTTNAYGTLSDFAVPSAGGYDGAGDRLAVQANVPGTSFGGATAYSYDGRGQLTGERGSENGGYSSPYGYDGVTGGTTSGPGDPTAMENHAQTFDADNRITGGFGSAFAWDGDGSPPTYNGVSLAFDPEARLTASAGAPSGGSGTPCAYGYTGDGLRASKTSGGATTYFLYDGDTPLCEMDSAGNVTATDTFGANGLTSRRQGSVSYFYLWDLSGSASQRYGTDGSAATLLLTGFGAYFPGDGPPDPFGGFGGQWGGYTDAETGLTLFTHRYYDWVTGRWLTRDPAGYDGGINLYGYCTNNPVNESDASGYMAAELGCKEAISVNAAIKLACTMINTAPISTNSNGVGVTLSEKKCLQSLCRSNMIIRCGSSHCKNDGHLLGEHRPGFFGPGVITLCTSRDGNPAFFEPGINTVVGNLALILIHEMLHECYRPDNGGPALPGTGGSPSNPADDGARSCMRRGAPYKAGY